MSSQDSARFPKAVAELWEFFTAYIWTVVFPEYDPSADYDNCHMSAARIAEFVLAPCLRGVTVGSRVLIVGDSTTHYPVHRRTAIEEGPENNNDFSESFALHELEAFYSKHTGFDVKIAAVSGCCFASYSDPEWPSFSDQLARSDRAFGNNIPDVVLLVGGWNDKWRWDNAANCWNTDHRVGAEEFKKQWFDLYGSVLDTAQWHDL